jgi:D-sedoheptulose 7-phosphate isomerase
MGTFEEYLGLHQDALNGISRKEISHFTDSIQSVFRRDGILWTAGNGGSASTASHAQCDLSKGIFLREEIAARVVCLTDMTESTTAWANDKSYEDAIANMCKNFVRSNDGLLLISGSGNSPNIVNALMYAKENQITVFGMTGFDGGKLYEFADISLHVPSSDMQVVENVHLLLMHWIFKDLKRN